MVSAALATLDEAHELIQLARQKHEDARAELDGITATSVNPKVESSSAKLGQVVASLDAAVVWRDSGLEVLDSYLDQIGARGSAGGKGSQGDQVTAPKLKSSDLEKEHAGSDDGDSTKSAFQRAMRSTVRNVGDFQKQGQTWTAAGRSYRVNLDPPPTRTHAGTAQPVDTTVPTQGTAPDPSDIAGNLLVIAVGLTEAASRIFKREKEKHGKADAQGSDPGARHR